METPLGGAILYFMTNWYGGEMLTISVGIRYPLTVQYITILPIYGWGWFLAVRVILMFDDVGG